MADQPNRRKNRIFGFEFDISVKWLVGIIVLGLVQFGVFLAEFKNISDDVEKMAVSLTKAIETAYIASEKDVQQDTRIGELERRLNARAEQYPLDPVFRRPR